MNKYQELLKEYIGETKPYKEWCYILGEQQLNRKAKELQLNKWQQYIEIYRPNGKITLVDIYDDNNLKIIESQGKYTTYIENYLMNYLKDCKEDYVLLSTSQILENLCMVNKRYFEGMNHPEKYANEFDVGMNINDLPYEGYGLERIIEDSEVFFSASYRLLKRIIKSSLKSMENRSLIQVNKSFRLYRTYTNENGDTISITHNCTDDEIDRILTVRHNTILEFNKYAPLYDNGNKKYYLNDLKDLYILRPKERDIFFNMLDKNICDEFFNEGYKSYSSVWRINMANKDCFEYEIKQLNYNKLNNNVQNKLLTAKDLALISDVLKHQLLDKYIKI